MLALPLAPAQPTAAAQLAITLLGTPQIHWDGRPLPIERRRSRALLYRLAAAPQPLSRDHLAFLFWPDLPDAGARRNLVVLLNHLRRALPDPRLLITAPDTVGLGRELARTDTAAIAAAIETGLRERRLEGLAIALDLCHGPFLDGFALPGCEEFESWMVQEREEWERRYLAGLAGLIEGHAARGDYRAALAAAQQALAADELAEESHRRLIALHAAAGDRAAALRQFADCVATLARELGVRPGPATIALHERVRDGHGPRPEELLADPAAAAAWREGAERRGDLGTRADLPAPPNPLIGRAGELAAIRTLLASADARLVTLTGPGGAGKTRLALQVAWDLRERFTDGVVFVPLAALREPGAVVGAIAAACGVTEAGGAALAETLRAILRDKATLLVLDNCEHLLPAAPTIASLLAAAPRLRVLATSRVLLNLAGERSLPVPPFPRPDPARRQDLAALAAEPALALLLARARALDPAFRLTAANAADLAAICARLDGLPLAIELAAARLKTLSPGALLARLDRRLALLDRGQRDLPDRHRTLRATLAWSHRLLGAPEQALFARLAAFSGGWTLAGAEAICAGDGDDLDVLDGIEALLDANLLTRAAGGDSEPRFGMLETIREYAAEQLAARDEAAALAARHAAFFADLAERAAGARGAEQGRWLAALDRDWANLEAAITWAIAQGDGELAVRLTGALSRFWLTRGRLQQGRHLIERALAVPLPEALSEERRAAHDRFLARANEAVTELVVPLGAFAEGQAHLAASAALHRARGQLPELALTLLSLSSIASYAGDAATAAAARAEGEALARLLDSPAALAKIAVVKGREARNTADAAAARGWLEASLAHARQVGDTLMVSHRLLDLAPVTLALGDAPAARAQAGEALALAHSLRHRVAMAMALNDLGEIARYGGETRRAAARYAESLRLRREMGNRSDVPRLLHNLAYLALHDGDAARATTLFRQSIDLFREQGIGRGVAEGLTGLACALATQGQPLRAARLWGAAEARREAGNWGMWPPDRVEYTRYTARARAAAPEAAFAAAWQAGRGLTPEQALADAAGGIAAPPVAPDLAPLSL